MPTNSPLNSELWHLSIDDLLGPMPDTFRLGGPGPFVINLRSSSVAMNLAGTGIAIGTHGHVYQIQRREEDTVRYRLRLGPFTTEDEADALLAKVREMYPSALTARATPEDLQALEAVNGNSGTATAATATSHPVPAVTPEPAPLPVATTLRARMPMPALDSTQTLRRLSPVELDSEGGLRWFVIQLSLSESPVDPDTVPILDIFSLYRLYTVSGIEQDRIMHALRLGFFAEQIAASAVANYLGAYYEKPLIKRVSVAERERFSTQYVEARKDIGATGTHTAIEITGDLVVRQKRTTAP